MLNLCSCTWLTVLSTHLTSWIDEYRWRFLHVAVIHFHKRFPHETKVRNKTYALKLSQNWLETFLDRCKYNAKFVCHFRLRVAFICVRHEPRYLGDFISFSIISNKSRICDVCMKMKQDSMSPINSKNRDVLDLLCIMWYGRMKQKLILLPIFQKSVFVAWNSVHCFKVCICGGA